MWRTMLFVLAGWLFSIGSAAGADGDSSIWRVELDTNWLGPIELHLQIEQDATEMRGRSLSGAVALLQELPGEHDLQNGLFVFRASQNGEDWRGPISAPWPEGDIELRIDDDTLSGTIGSGALAGKVSGARVTAVTPIRDYAAVLADFDAVVARKVFAPEDLATAAYEAFRSQFGRIAGAAADDLDLLLGFRWAWQNDPFSHFELKRSRQTAEQLFGFFDSYRVGFEAATLDFDGNVAILKVRTMMGADTIEQIEAAYDRIAEVEPAALIIDLRGNGGGAFAVKPLVEHVIDEPVDAGYFLSQVWNRSNEQLPTREQLLASEPWSGWSIIAFWKSVQEAEILRVRFRPAEPNYDGPVFVLLDQSSASATELAADALRSSGVTTSIGATTAGHMLSQSMFDVADGFVVSLPVADYYSVANGRIEGAGVPVDVPAASDDALAVALEMARSAPR